MGCLWPGLRAVGWHALHLLVRWAYIPLGRGGLGPRPACLLGELAAARAPFGKAVGGKASAQTRRGVGIPPTDVLGLPPSQEAPEGQEPDVHQAAPVPAGEVRGCAGR